MFICKMMVHVLYNTEKKKGAAPNLYGLVVFYYTLRGTLYICETSLRFSSRKGFV